MLFIMHITQIQGDPRKTEPIKMLLNPTNIQQTSNTVQVLNFSLCKTLKSFRMKIMFFPKYAPNGLHGVGCKLAYVGIGFDSVVKAFTHGYMY